MLVTKQFLSAIDFHGIFPYTMKVNGYRQLFGSKHFSKERNSYMFGTAGG